MAETVLHLAALEPGVPEICLAHQGEGASAGRPAVFVRTSGCNLRCWWCDTPYTWNWDGSHFAHRDSDAGAAKFKPAAERVSLAVDAAVKIILEKAARPERVVLTGGEPMMQQRALGAVVEALKRAAPGVLVEIETNGTIAPAAEFRALIDQFNVSPKLAGSRNPEELRRKQELLAVYAADPKAFFKFVVSATDELEEADALVAAIGASPRRVFLMPEGTDVDALDARGAWLNDEALKRGYGYSDRAHIRLFGDRRGT